MTDEHDTRGDDHADPHETDVTFADWSGLFPERVETDRLELRRLSRETVDLHAFYEVCADGEAIEEITEHLTWDPHPHPKETRDFLAAVEEGWEEGETAQYAIYPDAAETFAGCCGLTFDWDRCSATLGMWLRKRFWGRGYSGERAAALMALAFDHLDLEVVAVTHLAGNQNSRRAIQKYVDHFGGREEGLFRHSAAVEGEPLDERRYTVSQAEYRDAVDG